MASGVVREDVPQFRKRVGDNVLAGSNNSLIVLGRDRPAGVESGYETGAGTVHIVVGRAGSDPSFSRDRAFVYVSARTDVDSNLGLPERAPRGSSAAIVKSDAVRIVADSAVIKIGRAVLTMSADGRITIDGDISLGEGAVSRLVKGELLVQQLLTHIHPYVQGQPQTGPAVYPSDPTLQTILASPLVKVAG